MPGDAGLGAFLRADDHLLSPWRGDGQLASGAAENEIKESAITAKHALKITLLRPQNVLFFFLIFNRNNSLAIGKKNLCSLF